MRDFFRDCDCPAGLSCSCNSGVEVVLRSDYEVLQKEIESLKAELAKSAEQNIKLREALGGIRNICCDCASNPHTGENTECFICKTLKELEGEK